MWIFCLSNDRIYFQPCVTLKCLTDTVCCDLMYTAFLEMDKLSNNGYSVYPRLCVCRCYWNSLLKCVFIFHMRKFSSQRWAWAVLIVTVCRDGLKCSESRSGCSADCAVSVSLISCLGQGVCDGFYWPLIHINQPGSPDTGTSTRQPLVEQHQEWLRPRKIMRPKVKGWCYPR